MKSKKSALIVYNKKKAYSLDFVKKLIKILNDKYKIETKTIHNFSKIEKLEQDYFILFAISGDGTLLYVARNFAKEKVPVLSINFGKVGYITEFSPQNWEDGFNRFLENNYFITKRIMIECNIYRDGKLILLAPALNEVMITSTFDKILNLELNINENIINYNMDALIISTPTGSTAHSLSAGGPIIVDQIPSLLLVPISPFFGNTKPMIFALDKNLKMQCKIKHNEAEKINCLIDGQKELELQTNDIIEIKKYKYDFKLIKGDNDFFETLKKRLNN